MTLELEILHDLYLITMLNHLIINKALMTINQGISDNQHSETESKSLNDLRYNYVYFTTTS